MRLVPVLALLATAALAAPPKGPKPGAAAAQQAALARADAQCPGGTVKGCADAAQEAQRRGELPRAAGLHGRACEAGVAAACTALGEALSLGGAGLSRDDAQAARRLQRGCELGSARGCASLGTLVWQGRGVKKADPRRAFGLYQRACTGGDASGCFSAAICHRTGSCAPRSDAKARALLQRACSMGDARACSAQGGR